MGQTSPNAAGVVYHGRVALTSPPSSATRRPSCCAAAALRCCASPPAARLALPRVRRRFSLEGRLAGSTGARARALFAECPAAIVPGLAK
eukprot:6269082-Pyramimonas_sp.AAC.1